MKLTRTLNTILIKECPLILSGQGSGAHFLVTQKYLYPKFRKTLLSNDWISILDFDNLIYDDNDFHPIHVALMVCHKEHMDFNMQCQ